MDCDKKDWQLGISLGDAPFFDIMVNTLLGSPFHNKQLDDFYMCCHQSGISPVMFASDAISFKLNGRCSKAVSKSAPDAKFNWNKGFNVGNIPVFDKIFTLDTSLTQCAGANSQECKILE